MEITFVNPGVDYRFSGLWTFRPKLNQPFGLNPYTISIRSLIKPIPSVYLVL